MLKLLTKTGTTRCKCDVCKTHKQIRAIIRRGDKKEMRACIHILSEILCDTEEELGMANAYIAELRKTRQGSVA